ncbi:MAG: LptF/LptG family permease [Bacteroidales bacterium]|nr:LptF/LptG family permease [Bacteroidales bacterium]
MKIEKKTLDVYIIKKFLGTFFLALVLIMCVAIIFDFSEKIDDFLEKEAPVRAIIFDYYLNFIPYFATLFAPLFTFISVILFTSKMAYDTEIIAILSSGISFRRMMLPFFYSSLLIAVITFMLTNFVIPHSSKVRIAFEDKYYRGRSRQVMARNIHRQVYPNVYAFMETYRSSAQIGTEFSLEKFNDNGELVSKLMATHVKWDSTINKWSARNYVIRDIVDGREYIRRGRRIDTTLTVTPDDFERGEDFVITMNLFELNDYIDLLRLQGSEEVKLCLNEKHKRIANPFSIFILTLIGISVSSKRARGGIGMQIGFGLALSFTYIFFMQFATQFSLAGNIEPMIAMWLPNIIYLTVAVFLYKRVPK